MTDLRDPLEDVPAVCVRDAGEAGVFRTLTRQQTVIMDHVASGLTNKEIAQRLGLSPSTVKTHVLAIYQKTGLPNRIALAVHWLIFTGVLTRAGKSRFC